MKIDNVDEVKELLVDIDILFSTIYLDMFKHYHILIRDLYSILNYDKYIMKTIIKKFLEQ